MVNWLASDPNISAVTNLVGLLTAIYFVCIGIRATYGYRSSFFNGWKALKRSISYANACNGYRMAMDAHFFISFVLQVLSRMIFLAFFIIVLVTAKQPTTEEDFLSSSRLVYLHGTFEEYQKMELLMDLAEKGGAMVLLIVLSHTFFKSFLMARLVGKFRSKWYDRRRLPWTTVGSPNYNSS